MMEDLLASNAVLRFLIRPSGSVVVTVNHFFYWTIDEEFKISIFEQFYKTNVAVAEL